MKKRYGFVSNSSSASFVVLKSKMTPLEIKALLDYNYDEDNTDAWYIKDEGNCLYGSTNMDNDALDEYLEKIGFDFSKMEWRDS